MESNSNSKTIKIGSANLGLAPRPGINQSPTKSSCISQASGWILMRVLKFSQELTKSAVEQWLTCRAERTNLNQSPTSKVPRKNYRTHTLESKSNEQSIEICRGESGSRLLAELELERHPELAWLGWALIQVQRLGGAKTTD